MSINSVDIDLSEAIFSLCASLKLFVINFNDE